jgi:hypothetical protein
MKHVILFLALLLPAAAQVKIIPHGTERVTVEINGQPFTEFFIGPDAPKPYLHPLRSASGKVVSRYYPMSKEVPGEAHDHPHHRGLSFTHGAVNGFDFWANEPSQRGVGKGRGLITLTRLGKVAGGKKSGSIEAAFEWKSAEGNPLLAENRKMTFHADPQLRIIDFDIELKALDTVKFGDTKEGSFSIRLAPELEERQPRNIAAPKRTGKMVNAQGLETEQQVWGKRSEWVDYFGTVGGEQLGIAIFDHPKNPRHPTYWHSRAYGLFAANPFGVADFERDKSKDGSLVLEKGQSLRFRYRVVIHPGDTQSAGIAKLYNAFK